MVVLSGRVLTNTGTPMAGATINAYLTSDLAESTSIDSTTTDANGLWELTGLDAATYNIKVSKDGKVRYYYGASAVQLNTLTVGPEGVVISALGNITLTATDTVVNDTAYDSPKLLLLGAYDSDAGAGVTPAAVGLGFQVGVTTAGVAEMGVIDETGTPVGISFGEDGNITAANLTCATINVTGGGGTTISRYTVSGNPESQTFSGYNATPPGGSNTTGAKSFAYGQGNVNLYKIANVVLGSTSLVTVNAQLSYSTSTENLGNYDMSIWYSSNAGSTWTQCAHGEHFANQVAGAANISYYFHIHQTRLLELAAGTYIFKMTGRALISGKDGYVAYTDVWDTYMEITAQSMGA